MFELGDLSSSHLQAVKHYPGMFCVLVYPPTARVFERKFKESYVQMHVSSGRSLLVIGGRSDWVEPAARVRMKRDVLRNEDTIGYIVSLRDVDDFGHAEALVRLRSRFGLKVSDVPAVIFLSRIDDTTGYVFTLDRDRINGDTDAIMDDFEELFETVGQVVSDYPCPIELGFSNDRYNDLVEWRERTLVRLEPALRRLRMFKAVKRITPKLLPSAARGLAGLI